ncbi:MAG: response regulator [Anaerolineae bacterium]|nr:response regulator [Anaerolineae bacterium]
MANEKWILIVDDEDAILSVLQRSLSKLGNEYHVVTAADGFAALEELKKHSFDLVVTDYKMAGMNGMELLGKIREEAPGTRVILMTAYGSLSLENEAKQLEVYRYLSKPLEIDTFRQIVKEALNDTAASRPGLLVLSDDRYREIVLLLNQLQGDIGARCIFLTDAEGHFIARIGLVKDLPLEQIATLVGSSVATLLEAGRVIDGDTDTINLAYREGKRENLYVVNIGRQLLLIFLIDRGPYNSRIGSIWYYAQRAARVLQEKLNQADYSSPQNLFDDNMETALDQQMDELLKPSPQESPVPQAQPAALQNTSSNGKVLSFEEAIGAGLLNKKLSEKEK